MPDGGSGGDTGMIGGTCGMESSGEYYPVWFLVGLWNGRMMSWGAVRQVEWEETADTIWRANQLKKAMEVMRLVEILADDEVKR